MITALAIAILCLLFLIFGLARSLMVAHHSIVNLGKAAAGYAVLHKVEHNLADKQLHTLQQRVEELEHQLTQLQVQVEMLHV